MTTLVCTEGAAVHEEPITIRFYDSPRFAEGGPVSKMAEHVRSHGRFGDDVLLHVTPEEFQQLQDAWGEPTYNPHTGLPEYGFLSKVFKGIGKVAKLDPIIGSKPVQKLGTKIGTVAKKVLQNPIVQKLGPIAASIFLPGVGGLIAQAALGAVNAKLSGGNPLKGAITGGLGHFIGGGGLGVGEAAKPLSFLGSGKGPLSKILGGGSASSGAAAAASGAGPLSKIAGFFTNPATGAPAWGKIAGTALGVLGAAKGISDQPSGRYGPPVSPGAGFTSPLSPVPLNRRVVGLPSPSDYFTYGQTGGEHRFFEPIEPSPEEVQPQAHGGSIAPPMRSAGHYIKGPGSGRSDDIDAKLSNDEYVMDAETVALLGDGSPEEGARRLDVLRANLRKHKAQGLSKGKFSPAAKHPEQYLPGSKTKKAKGGLPPRVRGDWVQRVVPGGMPRGSDNVRMAELAAVQRFRDALKEQQTKTVPTKQLELLKFAGGGAIEDMKRFADHLEQQISEGNTERIAEIKGHMDTLHPGAGDFFEQGLAKGGKVSDLLKSIMSKTTERPIAKKSQLTPDDVLYMTEWLRQNAPRSDVPQRYDWDALLKKRAVQ